jgi:hypothetical protein
MFTLLGSIELLQLKWKQTRIVAKQNVIGKQRTSSSMSSSSMSRMTGRSSSVVFTATRTLLILTKNIINVQHRKFVVLIHDYFSGYPFKMFLFLTSLRLYILSIFTVKKTFFTQKVIFKDH